VESVVSQTWQEFEYIVIDGGSTDGSLTYIESRSDKINYWVSKPDKGVYNAMNKGIEKASGDYLLFLNSGDHLYSQDVLKQNHLHLRDKDLVYFDLQVMGPTKNFIKKYPEKLSLSYFMKDSLPHPATFIKKKAFYRTNLYDESLKIVSDWKFFMDGVCKYSFSYSRINNTLSTFYLDGVSSLKSNQGLIIQEKEKVLKQDYNFFLKEINNHKLNKQKIENLRKSIFIRVLVRLGIVNKF
jgi:glycosyltransferase involved in cell wall biosynthesis